MNGLELIKKIKTNKELETVPVLMVTGSMGPDILVKMMMNEADAFLNKSDLNNHLMAQLVSLVRVRLIYKETIKVKQLFAIKSLVGTYKHEFGNILAIIDGKLHKLEKIIHC